MSMRSMIILPLAAAFVLAGCGGSADSNGDGKITTDEAAAKAAAESITGPRPGQYRIKTEVLEMNVPGMPAGMSVEMSNRMAGGMELTYCITEQDAAKAAREMAGQSSQGQCEFKKYEIAGGRIDTEMSCKGEDGQATTIKTNGTISADGMDVTAEIDSPAFKQKSHVVHERIGDCAA
jgi:hypothetical protein